MRIKTYQDEVLLRKQLAFQIKAEPEKVIDLVIDLIKRVEHLESIINKNSGNSSKPPSSDFSCKPKPKSLRSKSGLKTGGQPGHEGKTLQQVDNPDYTEDLKLQHCPNTGVALSDADIFKTVKRQVFDIPPIQLSVTEYIQYHYLVPGTNTVVCKEFPRGVSSPVQYGSNLESLWVYLNQHQMLPLNRVCEMCSDLFGHSFSEASVNKAVEKCAIELDPFLQAVKERLAQAEVLHADETGLKKQGWLHSLSTAQDTYYSAHSKRGYEAIQSIGVLENFTNVLVHDCWKPYFRLDCEHALCNAHLLRELIFAEEQNGQLWAKEMKELLQQACHNPESKSWEQWNQSYQQCLEKGYAQNPPAPKQTPKRGRQAKSKTLNLIERLDKYKSSVLMFLKNPEVPFTNNQAERDIRMVKVKQKVSGAFRTFEGAQNFAKIRSYTSTCRKRGVAILKAIKETFSGKPLFA